MRRALGDRDTLEADRQARLVHHGEHAGHATVLLADEVASGAAAVAIDHGAGRRGVDAELVLDRVRPHVVAGAERAVGVARKFRYQEQRDAARACRRVREPCQHEVFDLVFVIQLLISTNACCFAPLFSQRKVALSKVKSSLLCFRSSKRG